MLRRVRWLLGRARKVGRDYPGKKSETGGAESQHKGGIAPWVLVCFDMRWWQYQHVHVWYCHVLSQDIASTSIVTIVSATFYNPYCWYLSSSYGPLMVAAVNPVLPVGLAAAPLPSSGNRRTEWNSYRCDSHSSILSWCQGMGQDYGYTKGRFVFVHSSLCWTVLWIT